MQDDFKQKRWDEISDQSRAVPNLPLHEGINNPLDMYDHKPMNKDMINFNGDVYNHTDKDIDNVVANMDQNTNQQNTQENNLGLDVGGEHISYVGGVPVIHSLHNDLNGANNHNNLDTDIYNAHNEIDKESRVKVFVTVFVLVIIFFASAVFAYLYFKDKAESSSSSPLSSSPSSDISENPSQQLQNTDQGADQNIVKTGETNMSGNIINKNNNTDSQNPEMSTKMNALWNNTSSLIVKDIKDFILDKNREYIIFSFKTDYVLDIKDVEISGIESVADKIFDIKSIERVYREINYDNNPVRVYNGKQSLVIIGNYKNNLIFANSLNAYKKSLLEINK